MNKKLSKLDILKLLPLRLQENCLIGIANPKNYDTIKPIFIEHKNKWTGNPFDFYPETKSIVVLIHFSPVAKDYRVEKYILLLGKNVFKRHGVKNHLLNKRNRADASRLLGVSWGSAVKTYDRIFLLKDAAFFAGLGQFGKNSLLINYKFGSDFKIQVLLVNQEMVFDTVLKPTRYPGCINCNECIKICPSGAINSTYRLNYKHCYLCYCYRCYQQNKLPEFVKVTKIPKRTDYYNVKDVHSDSRLVAFKNICRACQAFCPLNKQHYKNASLKLHTNFMLKGLSDLD